MTFLKLLVCLTLSTASSYAAELKGVKMPDQVKVEGKTLVLNGLGVRQATVFKVDVYVAGLYLEAPSKDAQAILASTGNKSIEMYFLRNVDGEDIAKAWHEGFENNCGDKCEALAPKITELKKLMSPLKKGDVMAFNFAKDKLEVIVRGKSVGTVQGEGFPQTILSIWLGKTPPNEGLKKGMLGLL